MTYLSSPGGQAAIVLGAAAVLIMVMFWLVAHFAYKDGHNDGRAYERNRANQKRLEAARSPSRLIGPARWEPAYMGQHAPWEPRLTVTRAMSFTIPAPGSTALTAPISHRTDSGELRMRADDYISRMQRREAAYRGELVS